VQLQIDHHSGVPVYRQIMEQIAILIESGYLPEGESLPSVKDLSGRLSVNPMTVSKALSYLEHEGLITRRPGRPLKVKERPQVDRQKRREHHLKKALNSAATVASQLGFTIDEALRLYRDLLEGELDHDNRPH